MLAGMRVLASVWVVAGLAGQGQSDPNAVTTQASGVCTSAMDCHLNGLSFFGLLETHNNHSDIIPACQYTFCDLTCSIPSQEIVLVGLASATLRGRVPLTGVFPAFPKTTALGALAASLPRLAFFSTQHVANATRTSECSPPVGTLFRRTLIVCIVAAAVV